MAFLTYDEVQARLQACRDKPGRYGAGLARRQLLRVLGARFWAWGGRNPDILQREQELKDWGNSGPREWRTQR